MKNNKLYLIVPCYNEEEILAVTAQRLQQKMEQLIMAKQIDAQSKILFVDDGSQDNTWQLITQFHQTNQLFTGIKLSHNQGHQTALLAGLTAVYAKADITITLDADLQDDINVMEQMLAAYQDGAEIVYGVRSRRKKDTFLKRFTANSFYKLQKKLGVEMIDNHADYRLMSQKAVGALLQYQESNLYLRGIIPQLGYRTAQVEYEREKRAAGKSKYSLKKMFNLALDGITSFSIKPLLLIFWLGCFFNVLGLISSVINLVLHFALGLDLLWTVLAALIGLTGIILICLGILGVYLGKMYLETKRRPRYLIEADLGD